MRKLAILIFQTLDGVMQAPSVPEEDNSGNFQHGGWAKPYWEPVMQQVGREAMAEPYDLLLGRRTYDLFADSFAQVNPQDPAAEKLNQAKKYVVTSQDGALPWHNSHAIKGDIVSKIHHLKNTSGPLLQVHGSWQLVQTLLKHELVDEYRLWTFPVIVGSGKKLFAEGTIFSQLRLIRYAACENGAFMQIYAAK